MRLSKYAKRLLGPNEKVEDYVSDPVLELEKNAEHASAWQAFLNRLSTTRNHPPIPDHLIGFASDMADPDLCLWKGKVLVSCGNLSEGIQFLRLAPNLARRRRDAVTLTLRASEDDAEFTGIVAAGDRARDAQEWEHGEYQYWRALSLYPFHPGYMTQYGHCVKEQGKYLGAEICYRSALALGAFTGEVDEHLNFVMAQQGFKGSNAIETALPPTDHQLNDMPSRHDVDFAFAFLTGQKPADDDEVLDFLRNQRSIRQVWLRVIGDRRFSATNLQLMKLLVQQSYSKPGI